MLNVSSTEHKFIVLINVKIPTIVDILTLISMINTASESLKARNVSIFKSVLSYYEQLKFHAVELSIIFKTPSAKMSFLFVFHKLLQQYNSCTVVGNFG